MRILSVFLVALIASSSAHAATWHVATNGNDDADGSAKSPFASLKRAIEAAAQAGDSSEIILRAGVYPGDTIIPAPTTTNPPPLLIRAAQKADGTFEEVVVDGGQRITEAQVVDSARGVYFLPFHLANYEPSMWETKTRTRYNFVADRLAVEAFPASLAPGRYRVDNEEQEGIFFRTSDGKPPGDHDLGMAKYRKGIMIQRPNVTVKGLHFRNFHLYFGVSGISIEAANVTVDSCDAWNCWGGFMVGEGIPDAKIRNCTARDVATGVKSYGKNAVVENCRFFRVNDSFEVQEYEQDQCGIQFYTSHTQTARGNLCVGFQAGIFIKASGGVATLENNTLVANPAKMGERGIGPNTWRPGSTCRGNVVVGYGEAISLGAGLSKDITIADNLIWLASNPKRTQETVEKIKAVTGGSNRVSPPQFVDAAREDFRLAPSNTVAHTTAEPVAVATTAIPARPARILGKPVVRVNDHGAVVLFNTDQPCLSALTWGLGDKLDHRVEDPRNWPLERPIEDATSMTAHTNHCLAITGSVEKGATYSFAIVLNNGEPVHRGTFTLNGPARTLHVATTGTDQEDGGTKERPFATLQCAVERALPGDRVVVASGIYTGNVWMTHGGVEGHPIRIESATWEARNAALRGGGTPATTASEGGVPAEPWGAVLDGRRREDHAIRLGRASRLPETWAAGCLGPAEVSHVRISGFEMRWYNGLCVRADESKDIVIEGCKFWGRHYVKGRPGICEGIGAYHCERVTIAHNLFVTLNTAVRFNQSVGLRLTNNTAARCFHRVIGIIGSNDIYLRNNSFPFGASYLLSLHGVDLKTVDSDYNNFAVRLREDAVGFKTAPAEEKLKREAGDFYCGESKSLAAWNERTPDRSKTNAYLATLTPWRKATGQDQHSISAHPRYVDPQSRDFRLLPTSPNVGAGENGANIGALGVMKN